MLPRSGWHIETLAGRVAPNASLLRPLFRRLLRFALPLAPAYLFSQVLAFVDRFLIAAVLSTKEAGVYSAGYSVASFPIQFIVGALAVACGPEIVRAWEAGGAGSARRSIARWAKFNTMLTGGMVLIMLVGASQIPRLVLGPKFTDVTSIVRIVAVAEFVLGIQWFAQRPLMLLERTDRILWAMAIAASANVLLNVLLIPRYGVVVAAWTTLFANSVYTALVMRQSARSFREHEGAVMTGT